MFIKNPALSGGFLYLDWVVYIWIKEQTTISQQFHLSFTQESKR